MIVSENSSLWDPMGRLTPVALVGRLLTQETYDDKLGWDSPANPRTTKSYFDLVAEWNAVGAFTFPRHLVSQTAKPKRLEVHTFVDASNVAYACATYLRLVYDDHVSTDLFFAKSRVKPENGLYLTIPRMELLAMLVGVRSTSFVLKAIAEEPLLLKPDSVNLWGDNQGVLYWINSSERQSAWVEHRLREIRGGYEQGFEFRYVPTLDNPADIASRGCYPKDLLDNDLWWHGPKYLQWKGTDNWPAQPPSYQPFSSEDLGKDMKVLKTEDSKKAASELRATLCLQPTASTYLTVQKSNLWLIRAADRSSWSRLISTTARVLQFIAILAKKTCSRSEFLRLLQTQVPARQMQTLPSAALDFAEKYHIRQAQRRHRSTMNDVKNLELFKDSDGIYRCRSRIVQSGEYSQHPIYLPRADAYTQLLLLHIHQHNSHCDQSTLIVKFRQRYFIPRSKHAASTTIRQCLDCRRYLSGRSFAPQKWADQPIERVQLSAPFTNIGLDYGGPFAVRLDSTSKDTAKRWICIFTCMSVRAIHLEVAKDLTADTFMRILDKFIARRTRPAKIWSDNATTFTAVEKILKDAVDDLKKSPNLSKYLEQMRIDWCHITPENPQQGGFYERLVGTVKRCLKATVGNKKLLADDFDCLVTRVERVVNERPLVNISDADTHPTVLRPIDFIRPTTTSTNKTPFITDKDDGVDSDDSEYEPPTRKSKEGRQLVKLRDDQQKALEKFSEIWNKQYLLCLADQYRKDLTRSGGVHRNPIAGEAVFIKPIDDNVPRREWKLARIIECRPGEDGVIRTAQIKQANGTVTERSVTQLYPVEISL
ncbi:Pao retrotransposon peptidase family protein [Aphelenchoides avenae]|nr:Pao retrotransposon peptidase family protein [Aphelenchus avenae]